MRRKLIYTLLVPLFFVLAPTQTSAQKWAIELNTLSLADFGTISPEIGVAVSAHFTLHVGGKLNFWTFYNNDKSLKIQDQHKIGYIGFRYWPWYVFSGWWFSGKLEYLDYLSTGIWRPAVEKGRGVGGGMGFGFTKLISEHFNIDFGIGGIGGYLFQYSLNNSQTRFSIRDEGPRPFIYPDMILIGLMYIF